MQITCPVLKVDKSYRRRCFIIDKIETLVGAEIHSGTQTKQWRETRFDATLRIEGTGGALRAAGMGSERERQ